MSNVEALGYLAAALTTLSFVPQAVKVIKTRDTASLSLLMYVAFTCGVALWLAYGVLIEDKAVIFANFVTLLLAVTILSIKLINDFGPRSRP